jgi:Asp-tRNA(Asn)/Glu-tRNA(Gln) amidotransferase A subunit family amidase
MGGASPLDPLSYPAPGPAARAAVIEPSLAGLRIAVSPDLGMCAIDPDVRACFEQLVAVVRSSGAEVVQLPALPGVSRRSNTSMRKMPVLRTSPSGAKCSLSATCYSRRRCR